MKYDFSVCLITKDENRYLPEWLAWHLGLGADHIYIYDNGSALPVAGSIPAGYRERVTVIDYPSHSDLTQLEAYDHWIANYKAETKWVAFLDTDEFLRVVDGTDIREFMRDYEDIDTLCVRFLTYNAVGQLRREERPVRERFTQTVELPGPTTPHKSICKAERLEKMGIRTPITLSNWLKIVDENKGYVDFSDIGKLPHEKIVIDHYYTRSYEEWVEKMERGTPVKAAQKNPGWFLQLNPEMAAAVAEYDAEATSNA